MICMCDRKFRVNDDVKFSMHLHWLCVYCTSFVERERGRVCGDEKKEKVYRVEEKKSWMKPFMEEERFESILRF